jgi:lipoprotein NlpD
MKKTRVLAIGTLVGVLAACSTPRHTAPVVDRSQRPSDQGRNYPSSGNTVQATAPQPRPVDGHGYYTVKKGDTLFHIALDAGQNYRDLVTWNNLANPNDIKVDQVLRVLPPVAGSMPMQNGNTVSGVETHPVPAPGSSTITALPLPSAAVAQIKNSPRGDKKPYSEGVFAELQKPDTVTTTVAVAPIRTETPKTSESRPVEKQREKTIESAPALPDDSSVGWIWPAEGRIVGTFDDGKKGIDLAGKLGQPVLAAGAGKVMYAGSGIRGYGNLVIVKHTNNLLSAYAYNKTILVKEGQSVTRGEKIAEMGNSDTDSVKLHFEIRQQGKPVDPSKFLPAR